MAAIVVVGAGIAGLSAAWKLQRAGHDVEVIEREAGAGGRMRSARPGDVVRDHSPQLLTSGDRNLEALAQEAGVADRIRRARRTRSAWLRDGSLHPIDDNGLAGFLRSPLLSAPAKLRLAWLLAELLRRRHILDPWHPERAASLDDDDMATFLRRVVGDEAFELLLQPAFSASFAAEPEQLSGVIALLALRVLGRDPRRAQLVGGSGLLEALAARLRVRGGRDVICVETEPDGARVRYATTHVDRTGRAERVERTLLADAVLLAVPGTRVPAICPLLTPTETDFFAAVRYVRGVTVRLLLERPLPRLSCSRVLFPRREGIGLYALTLDRDEPGASPRVAGRASLLLRAREADRLWEASDDEVVRFVLAELGRTPIGRLAARETSVERWDPMLPLFAAGYTRTLQAFRSRRERSPRVAFAGDYLVGPSAEMACSSGLRAASELVATLEKR